MRQYFLYLILYIFSLSSCKNDSTEGYEKRDIREISIGLYTEMYYKSLGVYGGESRKYFVTDSSEFRVYVGKCDENEYFDISVENSELQIKKYSRRSAEINKPKLLETLYYKLPSKYP